jgi:RNA polymerase sigma factor (sigma-70 family)
MNSDSKSIDLLLKKMQMGDQKAFKGLYDCLWSRMFFKAKSIVLCEDTSKDIVQEIWIDLWLKREIRDIKNIEAYLLRAVAINSLKYLGNHKLKNLHLNVIKTISISEKSGVELTHDLEALELAINNSLENLTPRAREVFLLSKFEDNSNQDIAAKLDISKKTVENHLSSALRVVRNSIASIVPNLILMLGLF